LALGTAIVIAAAALATNVAFPMGGAPNSHLSPDALAAAQAMLSAN
jgi:hypothetical protein